MAANITSFCLDELTDYFQFERLCHDLLSQLGYRNIEPLGGFNDKGRDAIHVSSDGVTSIFAYSVREDWRAKLAEDAAKVFDHGHECDKLVFVTTSKVTAGNRDEAVSTISKDYGWALELYSAERLRVLLDTEFQYIKLNHPQIFPPEMLRLASIRSNKEELHLLISYESSDKPLALWLARKLSALGYNVWCKDLPRIGSKLFPDHVDVAIKQRVCGVVALYSRKSLSNADLVRQRNLALDLTNDRGDRLLLPIRIDDFDSFDLDSKTRALSFTDLRTNWSKGLRELVLRLENCDIAARRDDGSAVAINSLLELRSNSLEPETLYSNVFEVSEIPSSILHITLNGKLARTNSMQYWAYRQISRQTFLSFALPPAQVTGADTFPEVRTILWRGKETVYGINSGDLISELIRKSVQVVCFQRGMRYCRQSRLIYVPHGMLNQSNMHAFVAPWGQKTRVKLAGERKYWRKSGSEYYRYHLSPEYRVRRDLFSDFVVILNVRVRMTNRMNQPLEPRKALSRRKHLCKDWWNREWLIRSLALTDLIAEDGLISAEGYNGEQIVVKSAPCSVVAARGTSEVE